jgi:hypothetical protein
LKDQVIEVRHANAEGRLHVARKTKAPDEWDPPVPVYDPYGPGTSTDEFIDDCCDAVTAKDLGEKALERLATSDKTTIVIERQPDGKMRVTSGSWDGEKVFLKDGCSGCGTRSPTPGSTSLAKSRRRTTGTRPMSPYGPGAVADEAND